MKTQILLDRAEEVAALFDQGFVLKLANGEEITIKAEGEIMPRSVVNVTAHKFVGAIDQSPIPAPNGHAAPMNGAQSRAAEKKQCAPRAPGKAADNGSNIDLFPCHFCDETFSRSQGRGRHESAAHPHQFKKKRSRNSGDFECPHDGCGYSTMKPGWLNNHIDREHGGRSIAVGM